MKTALALLCLALAGCSSAPVAKVKAGLAAVAQRGAAEVPARAEVATSRASLPLPAGTRVEVAPPAPKAAPDSPFISQNLPVTVTLPAPSVLTVETTAERASAPQAFTPPPPPSPSDLAAGRALWIFRIAIFAGVVAGLFGLIRGWDFVAIGGGCIAAGGLLGLALDAVPAWLWAILGAGAAISATGWAVWHFKMRGLSIKTENAG